MTLHSLLVVLGVAFGIASATALGACLVALVTENRNLLWFTALAAVVIVLAALAAAAGVTVGGVL